MSKYVKNLITEHLRDRFKDVQEALLVNMVGLDANANNRLRAELREKNIHVMVVKNSLAHRATEGTPLGVMFEGLTGTSAVCWGADDLVALAKEVTRLARDQQYEAFQPRGGVMDGERLTARQVADVSRWPSREELLAIVAGQVIGVASQVASQLVGPATQVASQIETLIERFGSEERGRCALCGSPLDLKAPGSFGEVFLTLGTLGPGATKCGTCGRSYCVPCYARIFVKEPIEGAERAEGVKSMAMTFLLQSGEAPCPSCGADSVSWRTEKDV